MGALITVVKNKKKELVILNRNFTKEELRSKLSGTILYPESWIEYVLEKGIFIPKDFIVVVKTDKNTSIEKINELVRTTVKWGDRRKLAIYPDGKIEKISSIWKGDERKMFPR